MLLCSAPLLLILASSPVSADSAAQERVEVIADQARQAQGFDLEKADRTIEDAFQGQKTSGVRAAAQGESPDDPKKVAARENAADKARQKGLKTPAIAGGPVVGEDKKAQAAPEKKGLLSELPVKQMVAGAALGAVTGGFLAMAFGGPMGLMVFGGAAMLACMAFLMNKK